MSTEQKSTKERLAEVRREMPDSYTVRSHAFGQAKEMTTWSVKQAEREAKRASMLPPEHAASLFETMSGKLKAVYAHGRNAFADRRAHEQSIER